MFFIKDNMCSEYGVSCFENYVLYLLNTNVLNWKQVFYKSYCNYNFILYQLADRKQSYSSIDFLERIQITAENLNLIKTKSITNKEIEKLEPESIFMVQITPQAVKTLFETTLWRNDHFILLYKKNREEYEYINDHPLYTGILSAKDLMNSSMNKGFEINIINNTTNTVDINLIYKLKEHITTDSNVKIISDISNLDLIRDSIGIYRVVIRRMEAFLSYFDGKELFSNLYQELDILYAKTEYLRIRKNNNLDALVKILERVREIDFVFMQEINERIKELI